MVYKDIVSGDKIFDFDDTFAEADGNTIKVECQTTSSGHNQNIDTYSLKKSDYDYDTFAKSLKVYAQAVFAELEKRGSTTEKLDQAKASLDRYLREIDNREKITAVYTGSSGKEPGLLIPGIKKEESGAWYLLVWEYGVEDA